MVWIGWLVIEILSPAARALPAHGRRPLLEQPLDNLVVATKRSRLQCIAEMPSLRVDVGPLLEQPLDDLVVAAIQSRLQRVAEIPSLRSDEGRLVEQPLSRLALAA